MPDEPKLHALYRRLKEYLFSILGPLRPILDHGFKAVYIALIVRLVSLLLHLILPGNILGIIETLELGFYVLISGVLCLYTFITFCWNLISHLWEELIIGVKETRKRIARRIREIEARPSVRQLPEGTRGSYINTDRPRTTEPERIERERERDDET